MFAPKYRTSFAHQYIGQYKGIKNIEKHAVVGTPYIKRNFNSKFLLNLEIRLLL